MLPRIPDRMMEVHILWSHSKHFQHPFSSYYAAIECFAEKPGGHDRLLDEGGTVPFIARYRKEVTGNLDEVQIRDIEEKLDYFRELEDRKRDGPRIHRGAGQTDAELKARIEATLEKSELEDLYLPYKPKRRTKATIAREKGLEPLAQYLWDQQPARARRWTHWPRRFVDAEKGVATAEEALEGARHIIAEMDQRERRHAARRSAR